MFDAWLRSAELFDALGEKGTADELRAKAWKLQSAFDEHFWCEDIGFYALALDSFKKPAKTLASNVGHLLWSGICAPEKANRVIDRLFQPDFWSGWGIRTLPEGHPSYNPHSYHNGSVWPHDNAIIALGCKRYGHPDRVAEIARDISRAAEHFFSNRLPELYAGVTRTKDGFPVQYARANVPQAWAAGASFHLLSAILGLQADVPSGKFYVDPVLPRWLPDVRLKGVRLGPAVLDLRVWRDGADTKWEAHVVGSDLIVEQRASSPWIRVLD